MINKRTVTVNCSIAFQDTYGSVSRYGLVAFASSLDQIGPMGRSVEDVAMLYGAICGHDPMDATSARREYPDFTRNLSAGVKGLRIGLPKEYFGEGVEPGIKDLVMKSVKALEEQGATVCEVSLPSKMCRRDRRSTARPGSPDRRPAMWGMTTPAS